MRRTGVAVVAVTASEVEVLPAEPMDELARLAARSSALEAENEGLWGEVSRLLAENERLHARVEALQGQLEEARRAAKRQAAFSRGEPSRSPRRGGRRSGDVMVGMVTVSRRGRSMRSWTRRLWIGVGVVGRRR